MSRLERSLGFTLLCVMQIVAGADSLSSELNQAYQQHIFGVRHPIHAGDQEFDAAGNPTNAGPQQEWEVYGGILIENLSLKKDRVRIQGLRVVPTDRVEKGKPAIISLGHVNFEIHLDKPLGSAEEVRAVLDRIFYLDESDAEHQKPELRRANAILNQPVYKITTGTPGIVYPKPVYWREPEFSEPARRAKFQGTELLSLVVDKTGEVVAVKIDRGLGYGLDQNAMEVIKTWRFRPAMRNGEAVNAELSTEVSFHLY